MLTIHVYFCEAMDSMQYRPTKANQEVTNPNHYGSVSDSLGRLASYLKLKCLYFDNLLNT